MQFVQPVALLPAGRPAGLREVLADVAPRQVQDGDPVDLRGEHVGGPLRGGVRQRRKDPAAGRGHAGGVPGKLPCCREEPAALGLHDSQAAVTLDLQVGPALLVADLHA